MGTPTHPHSGPRRPPELCQTGGMTYPPDPLTNAPTSMPKRVLVRPTAGPCIHKETQRHKWGGPRSYLPPLNGRWLAEFGLRFGRFKGCGQGGVLVVTPSLGDKYPEPPPPTRAKGRTPDYTYPTGRNTTPRSSTNIPVTRPSRWTSVIQVRHVLVPICPTLIPTRCRCVSVRSPGSGCHAIFLTAHHTEPQISALDATLYCLTVCTADR